VESYPVDSLLLLPFLSLSQKKMMPAAAILKKTSVYTILEARMSCKSCANAFDAFKCTEKSTADFVCRMF
jgi:hypothetical protein